MQFLIMYSFFTHIVVMYHFRTCGPRFLGKNAVRRHVAAALYDAKAPNGQAVATGGAWLLDGTLCACGAILRADGMQASDLHKLQRLDCGSFCAYMAAAGQRAIWPRNG